MENPFKKRANELFQDDEAFLSVVSPEPLRFFLRKRAEEGQLYDRLVVILGTPGSGKTTLARVFEYSTIRTALANQSVNKSVIAALSACHAVEGEPLHSRFLGARISLESDYREIWELPYSEEIRTGLLTTLVQARAVLAWNRKLDATAHGESAVLPKPDSEGALELIGGDLEGLVARARNVEKAVYQVLTALVPPDISQMPKDAVAGFRAFDAIAGFAIGPLQDRVLLHPLIIFDDAHVLHPTQYSIFERWLARRELKLARWILSRLDIFSPQSTLNFLSSEGDSQPAGLKESREMTVILLQGGGGSSRQTQRTAFRSMARDMSSRYLRKMPIFNDRNLTELASLLSTEEKPIPKTHLKELDTAVKAASERLSISSKVLQRLSLEVDTFLSGRPDKLSDIRSAMLLVMMHRHANRIPQGSLFQTDEELEPTRKVEAGTDIIDAARIFLHHRYSRPYYFGFNAVCDASNDNVEQFLHLCANLLEISSTKLIRNKSAVLDAETQTKVLKETASDMIKKWNFPQHREVKILIAKIASRCLAESLSPNAWLGPGANAFGVMDDEFEQFLQNDSLLSRTLHYASAYNAVSLVRNYQCQGKTWCLIELGGIPTLNYGLTLKRGGFLKSSVKELDGFLRD